METTIIIFAALMLIGILLMVNAITLKVQKRVPKWMLKGVQITSASDVDGFAVYMWLKTIVGALVTFCYAAYYIVAQLDDAIEYNTYIPVTYAALMMAYMIILTGAKDKFLKQS